MRAAYVSILAWRSDSLLAVKLLGLGRLVVERPGLMRIWNRCGLRNRRGSEVGADGLVGAGGWIGADSWLGDNEKAADPCDGFRGLECAGSTCW